MGLGSFFKKIGSKIVGGIKDIGSSVVKGIKTGVKGVLKFVNKLGIVGQIGLSLMLPGLGELVGAWAGSLMASGNVFGQMAGNVLNFAVNTASKIKSVVGSVTEGVVNVIGEAAGATLNKMGLEEPFKGLTKTLGFNKNAAGVAQGIDVSGKTFSSMMDVARSGLEDVTKAGSNLFKLDSYTQVNKFVSPETKLKIENVRQGLDTVVTSQDMGGAGVLKPKVAETKGFDFSGLETQKSESILGADIPSITDPNKFLEMSVDTDIGKFSAVEQPTVRSLLESPDVGFGRGYDEKGFITNLSEMTEPPVTQTRLKDMLQSEKNITPMAAGEGVMRKTGETATGYTAADFAEDYSRVSDSLASATSTGSYGDYTAFDIPDADQYAVEGAQLIDFFENNVRINYGGSSQVPSIYQRQSSWGQALNSRIS